MLFAEKKTNTQQISGIVAFIKTIKYRRLNASSSSSSSSPQQKPENDECDNQSTCKVYSHHLLATVYTNTHAIQCATVIVCDVHIKQKRIADGQQNYDQPMNCAHDETT